MVYSDAVLSRAKQRLAQAKLDAEQESERRIAGIYARYPRLQVIDRELKASVAEAISVAFSHGEDTVAAIEAVKEKNLALQEERSWLLQVNEIDEADLEPDVLCPLCGGRGYVGEVMCECLQELCRQEQKKELSSLLAGRETFDGFRLDYYPEQMESGNQTIYPRTIMEKTYKYCKTFAAEFGSHSRSMLFTGGAGLGKTYLSACIARVVAEKGFSVVYESAGVMFADFEAAKFGSADEALTRKYLLCDLLIIDDLGTEMTTQFTQSALYQIVNTRLVERRPTIVSTNLSSGEISARYLPATASRLMGTYEWRPFYGNDIRMMRK